MIDQQTSDKIIESYCNGFSFKSIAECFDVSPTSVRNHIVMRGVALRPKGRPRGSADGRPRKERSRRPSSVNEKRIERAIKKGFILEKELCDFCGSSDDVRYEFSEPNIFDLRWRCPKHRSGQ